MSELGGLARVPSVPPQLGRFAPPRAFAAARCGGRNWHHDRPIQATDEGIDALVYELYGLTKEEIAIVEGRDMHKRATYHMGAAHLDSGTSLLRLLISPADQN